MKHVLLLILLILPYEVFAENNLQFGRLPLLSDAQISPDGNHIAYLREMQGKYYIVTQSLDKPQSQPHVFGLSEGIIRDYQWANNKYILFEGSIPYYSKGDYEKFTMWRIGVLNTQTNETEWPFRNAKYRVNISAPAIVSLLPDDPEHILMSYYYTGLSGNQLTEVFKIKLEDLDKDSVYRHKYSDDYITSLAGEVLAYSRFEKKTDEFLWDYRIDPKEDFVLLKDENNGNDAHEYFDEHIFNIDEKTGDIYFFSRDVNSLRTLNKAEVKNGHVINKSQIGKQSGLDVSTALVNQHTYDLVGYRYIDDFSESVYFDKTLQQIQADLKATFPEAGVKITSYSRDFSRIITRISSHNAPLQYFLYDRVKGDIAFLGEGYPSLDKSLLSPVKKFVYDTSDNLDISSYITIPAKWKKSKPMVVMPHGGPEERDSMDFDWMRQFYASNGYAVFQPNFRGSSGYGENFAKKGYGEWGKRMQLDVDEGVKAVIEKFGINRDKICILGASYGGYVAMYSAASANPLYQCAISFAGVSELTLVFLNAKEQGYGMSYWKQSIGDNWDTKTLKSYSPLDIATSDALPLLMLHGSEDTIVKPYQSKKMYKQLKKVKASGMKHIELKGEDHWFSLGSSRQTFLKESLLFLDKHL